MQILILPSWYPSSYNEISGVFFKEQAQALAKAGHDVGVIATPAVGIRNILSHKKIDISNRYYLDNKVHTYQQQYLDFKIPSLSKLFKTRLFKKLFKTYLKKHGLPDIVHLHSYMSGEFALFLKDKYKIPFVVTEHSSGFARNTLSNHAHLLAQKTYLLSNANLAVSPQLSILLNEKYSGNFSCMPNGIDTDFFNLKPFTEKKSFDFINVALLDKNKNQKMLIQAFARVFKSHPSIKLTIVGDGIEYNSLQEFIKEKGMQSQISLYGKAHRKTVKTLLQKSDAFVLSSTYETFGVVLIEAMSSGLPVVSTKCGGPQSIIKSDKLGLLCDLNEESLSKNLIALYNSRHNYKANEIRQFVQDNFSQKAICNKLISVYTKVIK
jgi:glycosyltransferase involved in cell wall biosynthesis